MRLLQQCISLILIQLAAINLSLADQELPQPIIPDPVIPSPIINQEELDIRLRQSVEANNLDAARLYLLLGANPNTRNAQDIPLIGVSAIDGTRAMSNLLMNANANIHALTTVGQRNGAPVQLTPILLAAYRGHQDIVNDLLERGANAPIGNLTPLQRAAHYNATEAVLLLLETEAYVYEEDELDSVFMEALFNNNTGLVTRLLDEGADIHTLSLIQQENEYQQIPAIVLAAGRNFNDIVTILLERGAWETIGGLTPLESAIEYGYLRAVELFINRGYTVTPDLLHRAARRGNMHMVQLLLNAGANPRATNDLGATPAMVARANGHEALANYIAQNIEIDPSFMKTIQYEVVDQPNFPFSFEQTLLYLLLAAFSIEMSSSLQPN